MNCQLLLSALLALPATVVIAQPPSIDALTTISERSGFRITGRYDEVDTLCHAFETHYSGKARCFGFGTTPEGRTLWALAASHDGVTTAAQARTRRRPVILAQGGIHAGEIDGKDAGFLVLRELLADERPDAALRKVTFVLVPVFSPDGHERFGRWNRPNQNGPEAMGWRTTAQNYNLNRDYAKADAPEMRAMLGLLNEWDAAVYIDLHATDGAQFEHDIAVLSGPDEEGDVEIAALASSIRDRIVARLDSLGALPLPFYPDFAVADDPSSGVDVIPLPPRFSWGYWGLSNRVVLVVETHSWKDYPTRVRLTAEVLRSAFDLAAREGATWLALQREADRRAATLSGAFPLSFGVTGETRTVEFRGYAYERSPSEVSGALMTRYDPTRRQIWRLPIRDRVRAVITTTVPRVGYLLPPAVATWLSPKLKEHGIRHETVAASDAPATVHAWRATDVSIGPQTIEGHALFKLQGAWRPEERTVPAGSVVVPIAQPKARLIMALLEPEAPDSYASWGFFATAFEKKEYMEPYVAEQIAREMLAADPRLREVFSQRVAQDPTFAGSADARLEFFYRRHPSWDEHYNLYPIYRLENEFLSR